MRVKYPVIGRMCCSQIYTYIFHVCPCSNSVIAIQVNFLDQSEGALYKIIFKNRYYTFNPTL